MASSREKSVLMGSARIRTRPVPLRLIGQSAMICRADIEIVGGCAGESLPLRQDNWWSCHVGDGHGPCRSRPNRSRSNLIHEQDVRGDLSGDCEPETQDQAARR